MTCKHNCKSRPLSRYDIKKLFEQIDFTSLKQKNYHYNYPVPNLGNLGNIYMPSQFTDRNKDPEKLSSQFKVTEKRLYMLFKNKLSAFKWFFKNGYHIVFAYSEFSCKSVTP